MKTSRHMVVWMTALAVMVGVSSAFGASIVLSGDLCETPDGSTGDGYTVPASQVTAMTADGSMAAGDSVRDNGARIPMRAWAPYGGPPNMIGITHKGGGWTAGIGIASGGNVVLSGNVGSWNYATGNIGRYSLNGTSFGTIKAHNGKTSESLLGANSVAADGTYLVGRAMRDRPYGYVWKTNNGTSVGNATKVKGKSGTTVWNSASVVNTMIGQDRNGNNQGKDGAVYCSSISGKAVQSVPALAGEPSYVTRGQGRGISDQGAYTVGYMYTPVTGPYVYAGFRWSPGDGTSTKCVPYGSDILSWAGDVADNGRAGGWSYGDDPAGHQSGYDAAFWPHPSICVLLQNYLDALGVDTSEWKSLKKVQAVSACGNFMGGYGQWAADDTWRGFIADLRAPIAMDLDIQPDSLVVTNTNVGRLPIHLYGSEAVPGEDIALDSVMIEGTVEPLKVKVVDLDLDGINDLKIHISRQDLKDAMNLQEAAQGEVVAVNLTAARASDGWPLKASDTLVCDRGD